AQTEPDLSKRTVMLSDATKLAKRPDEQKLLLAAWGNTPTLKALDTLRPFLEQPAVRNEAALAIVNVAGELAGQSDEGKGRAKPALRAVLRRCENAAIRENAQALLAGLD
ncbi:MAG TPA: hypothetical protein PKL84_07195, partial [Candidatus Hydrogenedentes bacterium]|nr:hypothetical protein [Candidatus Hydrogenedentota bacterium]